MCHSPDMGIKVKMQLCSFCFLVNLCVCVCVCFKQMSTTNAEVGMEDVLHSQENAETKTPGEKKKGRERGKVQHILNVS